MPKIKQNIKDSSNNSIGDLWEINSTLSMFINPKEFWNSVFENSIEIKSSKDQRLPYENKQETINSILDTLNTEPMKGNNDFYVKSQFSIDPVMLEGELDLSKMISLSDGNHRFLLIMCCFYKIQHNYNNNDVDGFSYIASNGDVINYEFIDLVSKTSVNDIKKSIDTLSERKTNQLAIKDILETINSYDRVNKINWDYVLNNILAVSTGHQLVINLKTFKDSNLTSNEQTNLDRINNILNQDEYYELKEWIRSIEIELLKEEYNHISFNNHKEFMITIIKVLYYVIFDTTSSKVTEISISEELLEKPHLFNDILERVNKRMPIGGEKYYEFISIFALAKNMTFEAFLPYFKRFIKFSGRFNELQIKIIENTQLLLNYSVPEFNGILLHFTSLYLKKMLKGEEEFEFNLKEFLSDFNALLEICIDEVQQADFVKVIDKGSIKNGNEIKDIKLTYEKEVRFKLAKNTSNSNTKAMAKKLAMDEIKDLEWRLDKYRTLNIFESGRLYWNEIFNLFLETDTMFVSNSKQHENYKSVVYNYLKYKTNLNIFKYIQSRVFETHSKWKLEKMEIHHIVPFKKDILLVNVISNLLPINEQYHKNGTEEDSIQLEYVQKDLILGGSSLRLKKESTEIKNSYVEIISNVTELKKGLILVNEELLQDNGWEKVTDVVEFDKIKRPYGYSYHHLYGKEIILIYKDGNGNSILKCKIDPNNINVQKDLVKYEFIYILDIKNFDGSTFNFGEKKIFKSVDDHGVYNSCEIVVSKKK